tara:strand:- start:641 stop:1033 length:393 start_codon:yes stop_codon:yes gene_type:complete
MIYTYKNITTTTGEILLDKITLSNSFISSIVLCNTDNTNACIIDLYLYRTYGNFMPESGHDYDNETKTQESYYLFKNLTIPKGATLHLESSDICIDYGNLIHSLYIKTDNTIDAIIKTKTGTTGNSTNTY